MQMRAVGDPGGRGLLFGREIMFADAHQVSINHLRSCSPSGPRVEQRVKEKLQEATTHGIVIFHNQLLAALCGEMAFTVPLFDEFMRRVMKFRAWGG